MAPGATPKPTRTSEAERARLRRNQRNSRARKAAYMNELHQSSITMRQQIHMASEEIRVLRELLAEAGVSHGAIAERLAQAASDRPPNYQSPGTLAETPNGSAAERHGTYPETSRTLSEPGLQMPMAYSQEQSQGNHPTMPPADPAVIAMGVKGQTGDQRPIPNQYRYGGQDQSHARGQDYLQPHHGHHQSQQQSYNRHHHQIPTPIQGQNPSQSRAPIHKPFLSNKMHMDLPANTFTSTSSSTTATTSPRESQPHNRRPSSPPLTLSQILSQVSMHPATLPQPRDQRQQYQSPSSAAPASSAQRLPSISSSTSLTKPDFKPSEAPLIIESSKSRQSSHPLSSQEWNVDQWLARIAQSKADSNLGPVVPKSLKPTESFFFIGNTPLGTLSFVPIDEETSTEAG